MAQKKKLFEKMKERTSMGYEEKEQLKQQCNNNLKKYKMKELPEGV